MSIQISAVPDFTSVFVGPTMEDSMVVVTGVVSTVHPIFTGDYRSSHKANAGAIAGGVVGGLGVVAIAVVAMYWIRRKYPKGDHEAAPASLPPPQYDVPRSNMSAVEQEDHVEQPAFVYRSEGASAKEARNSITEEKHAEACDCESDTCSTNTRMYCSPMLRCSESRFLEVTLDSGTAGLVEVSPMLSQQDTYRGKSRVSGIGLRRHKQGVRYMLLTPRTYQLAHTPDDGSTRPEPAYFLCGTQSRTQLEADRRRAIRMLLLHQTGSVKVGEVVRYTVTYTPAEDRILPAPACLHVRIRNTSAIPLRAAYLHGPYTIHVSAYPATFNPNSKHDDSKTHGYPDFEPNVKAGASWSAKLTVPEHVRQGDESTNEHASPKSATWIIEVASQIIFSNSASVNYEVLVARDERSLDLGFTAVTGNSHGTPGKVQDHQQGKQKHVSNHRAQPKGVYSKAVQLVVDDTTSLWNKPELPEVKDSDSSEPADQIKQKHIHLVLVTHGLHSNLGADMLYLKESIDATARQAREDRRRRRRQQRGAGNKSEDAKNTSTAPLSGGQDEMPDQHNGDDSDEEEVVVRGFNGNVIKTERGIQYLGKRLAKYVLQLTYPDQPFLPIKKSVGQKISNTFSPVKDKPDEGIPAHDGSTVHRPPPSKDKRAYKFTSISFIGHSLGGLVQTYAIAYIHKHSPQFFDKIKPINFIAMASPMLGLSNENPMYVKFALDFGLVGRTGQDLGLTWRTPTIAKSGWTAMSSVFGNQSPNQHDQEDPGAKPLLRILPTGPAHIVLRMFRNRTLYSNVVNDGIVPLRTSCLLFLDWRGLDRVDKARRENGLIGTVAVWGFGQLTGQNASPSPSRVNFSDDESEGAASPSRHGDGTAVPLPAVDTTNQDDEAQTIARPADHQYAEGPKKNDEGDTEDGQYFQPQNTLMQWWSYIRPTGKHTTQDKKMFNRSQTVHKDDEEETSASTKSSAHASDQRKRPQATRGDSIVANPKSSRAPPKTTIFESAGDLINPPVPPQSWIIDPSTRARTIFHDRVYHPEDIPPPPSKKRPAAARSMSVGSNGSEGSTANADEGQMRVEEKIARAYHKDLSWRKVLVRLEPDAHNNMIVRRMFANAYGWPVVKHLCDTHFADTYSAQTRDEDEPALDRAQGVLNPVQADGEHVKGQQSSQPPIERTDSELREVPDELAPLKSLNRTPKRVNTMDSTKSIGSGDWDAYFDGTSDEEDENDDRTAIQKFLQLNTPKLPSQPKSPQGTSDAEITDFLRHHPAPIAIEAHRGLGVSPSSRSQKSSKLSQSHEADSLHSLGASGNILSEGRQVVSPPVTPIIKISEVGLGLNKSLDKSAPSSPLAKKSRSESGLREQMARPSVGSATTGKDDPVS
ncbi:putative serine esterase-domain-containing protein [Ampelomyces quisqualis]|uniref:Putative serine esterase-domain-containing protein n=1 Tax=Ampelomyces quisqualis TaxID=50730 RepID=A0A6A5R172_AMPQU|nr:putative serine esterase-domain-containing protein [Ampelomyces quisqualis]